MRPCVDLALSIETWGFAFLNSMQMYYMTYGDTETGRKFKLIQQKRLECKKAQNAFAEKYGFKSYRPCIFSVFGGISSCVDFIELPDRKVWSKNRNIEYYPKGNNKEGKKIKKEIESLPLVISHDLNMCIGFDGSPFKTIGFGVSDVNDIYGFIVEDQWNAKIPEDCNEITAGEYKKHFQK